MEKISGKTLIATCIAILSWSSSFVFIRICLHMIALNYGEVTVTASIASFIIGLNPIISMLWAMLFFREKVHYKCWVGVGVSLLGLYIIAASQFHNNTLSFGILYIFFAVLCAGIYNVGQKPLLKVF